MLINNYSDLEKILNQYQIDTSKWSHQEGNKTIAQLLIEIQQGESALDIIDCKLVRTLKVASIKVKFKLGDNYFQLVEDKQIFLTGKVRKRELVTITEKIKQDETPLIGAYRGLAEEINLYLNEGLIFENESRWQKISPSYPNLISIYQVFNYYIILGKEELKQVRFSEYQAAEEMVNLFTLKPCDNPFFIRENI
jgi:hypothetical protein